MQVAALDNGATADKLVSQIAELKDNGQITTDLKDWAYAVRWVGNDAAHPNGVPRLLRVMPRTSCTSLSSSYTSFMWGRHWLRA